MLGGTAGVCGITKFGGTVGVCGGAVAVPTGSVKLPLPVATIGTGHERGELLTDIPRCCNGFRVDFGDSVTDDSVRDREGPGWDIKTRETCVGEGICVVDGAWCSASCTD